MRGERNRAKRVYRVCQLRAPTARTHHTYPPRHSFQEELIVKFPVQKLFATRTLAACVAVAASFVSVAALAQSTQANEQPTRASIRKANHRLEHNVRTAITRAKIPGADIRIVARGGKVTLDGTVPDQAMVEPAGTAAGTVAGVTSVQNLLTMREAGH
jgi:osmotically-inducible protein OsmY